LFLFPSPHCLTKTNIYFFQLGETHKFFMLLMAAFFSCVCFLAVTDVTTDEKELKKLAKYFGQKKEHKKTRSPDYVISIHRTPLLPF
jgi:hypothetical protein